MKYSVSVPVPATATIEVEASSKEEALEKAEDEFFPILCHQCANEIELGEPDFESKDISIKEI